MVIGLNIGVLGLFSLESVTMAELFGSRTRFTQLALAKEIGGILATAIGPVVAATLTAVTGSWWPIAAMLVVYSLITLVSALLSPETRGPRPGPAGGRGMKSRRRPRCRRSAGRRAARPDARRRRGADRDGVGRDLRLRPGLLAARLAPAPPCCSSPLVLGHEMAGRIAGLGAGVTGLQVGQRVTVHPADPGR